MPVKAQQKGKPMIKVLLVDDHPLFREGLKYRLSLDEDIEVAAEAENGKQALELIKNNDFDIVYTSHCLEHVQNIVPLLLDIYRILKKGGHLLIRVPHVSYIDSLGDLTHVRLFSYSSLDFLFFKYHQQLRNDEIFKLIKRKIVFGKFYSYGLVLCNIVIV